jgi:hypothetical protein
MNISFLYVILVLYAMLTMEPGSDGTVSKSLVTPSN